MESQFQDDVPNSTCAASLRISPAIYLAGYAGHRKGALIFLLRNLIILLSASYLVNVTEIVSRGR